MRKRFITKEVKTGHIGIGGNNPIRVQSMVNTNTLDTEATVTQALRLADAGCEMVRITAPGIREAEHLAVIRDELLRRGYNIPLIADIHFNPKAAEIAAAIVDKVRINPGNYTDRNRGRVEFSQHEYNAAVDRIGERFRPLIGICKKYGTAMRIGSNHGSLSERIVSRYGNTPRGMVEAALEFVRICREEDFHDLVLSMKASNVRVMVHATRLLVKKMMDEQMNYPIHLGVTEAGDGTSGRIKSAAGIGSLLADGIGDTIRVSLTEPPENEIPVAKQIVKYFEKVPSKATGNPFEDFFYQPFEYQLRRTKREVLSGDPGFPVVVSAPADFTDNRPDIIMDEHPWQGKWVNFSDLEQIPADKTLITEANERLPVLQFRNAFRRLHDEKKDNPVILKKTYDPEDVDTGITQALDFGPLFIDGFGDGIWMDSNESLRLRLAEIAFEILQATGARISRTEYIACPSCGRTMFDIQKSLNDIKEKTAHLAGLKIAVMGCIVNGPGEMADADYGYVGMGAGKVVIFKGKEPVKKNVDESVAVDELVQLIRDSGDWKGR